MPAKLRTAAAVPLAMAFLFLLTSCFLAPTPTPTATPTATGEGQELFDTTWTGTDSEGDDWSYLFQGDGTVEITLNGETFDDASDVWSVNETEIVINVNGGDEFGDIIHTGEYLGLDEPIALNVRTTVGERTWTISIERQG